jgi:hypothetical protein
MNKSTAFMLAVSALLLTGCCSAHYASEQWEYKVTYPMPPGPDGIRPGRPEQFLNELGKDGWVLVTIDQNGEFYLKRPKK